MLEISDSILYLIIFFFIYSFLGWIIDSLSKSFYYKKLCSGGFLYGPYCPIFGVPALLMIIFSHRLNGNMIIFFFLMIFVISLWEYLVALMLETLFNKKYWDYSNERFNYKGRICLKSSITWGVLSVLFVTLIHQNIEKIIISIPRNILLIIASILVILFLLDFVIRLVKQITNRPDKLQGNSFKVILGDKK